jgi:large subunit ribosomal protein L35
MPKMKTHSGAAKRFRKTTAGFKHRRVNRNHILTKKPQKRKRHLRGFSELADGDRKQIKRLLPKKAR